MPPLTQVLCEVDMSFLFVALGGALGAVARYAISLIPVKTGFPVLTLITNIMGAVLIGFIVGVTSSKEGISDNTVFRIILQAWCFLLG